MLGSNHKSQFEIKISFSEGLNEAFETVTNPMRYPEIHPLITKVVKRNDHHFLCFETLHVLFIPYPFHYWVRLTKNIEDKTVIMKSEVKKGVDIKLVFKIIHADNQHFISEKIEIKGPCIPRLLLMLKLKRAHHQMFNALKKVIQKKALSKRS